MLATAIAILAIVGQFTVVRAMPPLCDEDNDFSEVCEAPAETHGVYTCYIHTFNRLPCGVPSTTTSLTLIGDTIPENMMAESILYPGFFDAIGNNLLKLTIIGNVFGQIPSRTFFRLTSLQILNLNRNNIWGVSATAFPSHLQYFKCGEGVGESCSVAALVDACGLHGFGYVVPSEYSEYLWHKSAWSCECDEGFSWSDSYGCTRLSNPDHYYNFNGNTEDDGHVGGDDLTATGTPIIYTTDTVAPSFGQYIEIEEGTDLSIDDFDFTFVTDNSFSLAIWVNVDRTNDYTTILYADSPGIKIYLEPDQIYNQAVPHFYYNGGDYSAASGGYYEEWFHLAFTNDNGIYQFYINGQPLSSAVIKRRSVTTFFDSLTGGALNFFTDLSGTGDFDGMADELRLFDHAITAAEVNALYNLEPEIL